MTSPSLLRASLLASLCTCATFGCEDPPTAPGHGASPPSTSVPPPGAAVRPSPTAGPPLRVLDYLQVQEALQALRLTIDCKSPAENEAACERLRERSALRLRVGDQMAKVQVADKLRFDNLRTHLYVMVPADDTMLQVQSDFEDALVQMVRSAARAADIETPVTIWAYDSRILSSDARPRHRTFHITTRAEHLDKELRNFLAQVKKDFALDEEQKRFYNANRYGSGARYVAPETLIQAVLPEVENDATRQRELGFFVGVFDGQGPRAGGLVATAPGQETKALGQRMARVFHQSVLVQLDPSPRYLDANEGRALTPLRGALKAGLKWRLKRALIGTPLEYEMNSPEQEEARENAATNAIETSWPVLRRLIHFSRLYPRDELVPFLTPEEGSIDSAAAVRARLDENLPRQTSMDCLGKVLADGLGGRSAGRLLIVANSEPHLTCGLAEFQSKPLQQMFEIVDSTYSEVSKDFLVLTVCGAEPLNLQGQTLHFLGATEDVALASASLPETAARSVHASKWWSVCAWAR